MAQVSLRIREAESELPKVCMRCGDRATEVIPKTMAYVPTWINITILAGLLPYLILHLIMTKRVKLQAPLCEHHRNHWRTPNLIVWSSFTLIAVLSIACITTLVASEPNGRGPRNQALETVGGFLCLASMVLGLGWLILYSVYYHTSIRATEITESRLSLTGVHEDFIEAYEEARVQRRRRRSYEDEDEDDELPRRTRRSREDDEDDAPPRRPGRSSVEDNDADSTSFKA